MVSPRSLMLSGSASQGVKSEDSFFQISRMSTF